MLPKFVQILNQSIDEKYHSFQRHNQMKKSTQITPDKEFFVINIKVTFSLKLLQYIHDEIEKC